MYDVVMCTMLIVAHTCFVDTLGADVIASPRDNMRDVQMVVIYVWGSNGYSAFFAALALWTALVLMRSLHPEIT